MNEHFGSEFGLSRGEVIYIIQSYDCNLSSCINYTEIGSEIEKEKLGVIAKYVHFPMSAEFIEIRKKYHRCGDGVSTYLAALQNLLFPEDYVTPVAQDHIVDKADDPLYRGLVMALFIGTSYSKSQICALLNITDSEYRAIKLKQSKLMEELI